MSGLKFNHVFAGLLLISLVSAFVFPRKTSGIRANAQALFYPVAKPARMIASAIRGPFDRPSDKRPEKDVVAENVRLRTTVASLTGQIEALQKIAADREAFGVVGKYCTPVPVMGSDPGTRDSLSIVGTFDPNMLGQPVLYVGGLAGTVERAGVGGAQVRLVTDRGFRASALIGMFLNDGAGGAPFKPIRELPPALIEGTGRGGMIIRNLELKKVSECVPAGASVVLHDKDFPMILGHQTIGKVISIRKRTEAPLLAEIEVKPEWNLMALREVMVLNRSATPVQQASND